MVPFLKRASAPIIFQIINAAFCVIVVLSNIISVKMVKFPFLNVILPAGL